MPACTARFLPTRSVIRRDEHTAAQIRCTLCQGHQAQRFRNQTVFGLQPGAMGNEDVDLAEIEEGIGTDDGEGGTPVGAEIEKAGDSPRTKRGKG